MVEDLHVWQLPQALAAPPPVFAFQVKRGADGALPVHLVANKADADEPSYRAYARQQTVVSNVVGNAQNLARELQKVAPFPEPVSVAGDTITYAGDMTTTIRRWLEHNGF